MLTATAPCQVLSVGEIKEQKGFKKCFVLVRTKELRDEGTNEVIRKSGDFQCEVALSNDKYYNELTQLASHADPAFVPCVFILRSFTYQEKGVDKLGKQLQLKRWWR